MGRLSLGLVPEAVQVERVKARGLLERRGSNASLTLDLGLGEGASSLHTNPPKESSSTEFLTSAGNRMTRRQLTASLNDVKTIHSEFIDIPLNHAGKAEIPGAGLKNRYKSIWPNPSSMVRLRTTEGDPASTYVNANFIRGYDGEERAYIATQGPLPNTVDDFWRMCWEQKCPCIVMMTKLREKGRLKCEPYLPAEGEGPLTFGAIRVTLMSYEERAGFLRRRVLLEQDGEARELCHFWLSGWPDGRAPLKTGMELIGMAGEVEGERKEKATGPVLVHCSAGIGRTGCFIATCIGIAPAAGGEYGGHPGHRLSNETR